MDKEQEQKSFQEETSPKNSADEAVEKNQINTELDTEEKDKKKEITLEEKVIELEDNTNLQGELACAGGTCEI